MATWNEEGPPSFGRTSDPKSLQSGDPALANQASGERPEPALATLAALAAVSHGSKQRALRHLEAAAAARHPETSTADSRFPPLAGERSALSVVRRDTAACRLLQPDACAPPGDTPSLPPLHPAVCCRATAAHPAEPEPARIRPSPGLLETLPALIPPEQAAARVLLSGACPT